jgi:hypothetical protein
MMRKQNILLCIGFKHVIVLSLSRSLLVDNNDAAVPIGLGGRRIRAGWVPPIMDTPRKEVIQCIYRKTLGRRWRPRKTLLMVSLRLTQRHPP